MLQEPRQEGLGLLDRQLRYRLLVVHPSRVLPQTQQGFNLVRREAQHRRWG